MSVTYIKKKVLIVNLNQNQCQFKLELTWI